MKDEFEKFFIEINKWMDKNKILLFDKKYNISLIIK